MYTLHSRQIAVTKGTTVEANKALLNEVMEVRVKEKKCPGL